MAVNVSFGGTAQFTIAGVLYSLAGTIKVKVGGITRKAAIGPSGPTGNWIETNIEPEIEAEIFDDPSQSVTALQATTGVTVQAQGRNGKTYMLYNAFVTDAIEPDMIAGKYTIKFSGTQCLEITT